MQYNAAAAASHGLLRTLSPVFFKFQLTSNMIRVRLHNGTIEPGLGNLYPLYSNINARLTPCDRGRSESASSPPTPPSPRWEMLPVTRYRRVPYLSPQLYRNILVSRPRNDFKFQFLLFVSFARLYVASGLTLSQGLGFLWYRTRGSARVLTNPHHPLIPLSLGANKAPHFRRPYVKLSPHHYHRSLINQFPTNLQ